MAISATHFELLKELRRRGELRDGCRVLEIGEAYVYGDLDPDQTRELLSPANHAAFEAAKGDQYALAKLIYKGLCSPRAIVSIDASGPTAIRHDLNVPVYPIHLGEPFDLCINHGTAEHIFDIGNVFRTMHANTVAGGLMIHESPFTGWVDHGFYCLQPTLFWDLARANAYEVVLCVLEHLASKTYGIVKSRAQILELKRCDRLADNLMLFVALRKTRDADFVVPMQGVYTDGASESDELSWRELR